MLMNCVILKGLMEWSCSFQHGRVDKRPQGLNPPKISPLASPKWRGHTANQVYAQRRAEDHPSLWQSCLTGNRGIRGVVPRASLLSTAQGSQSVALLAHVTKLRERQGLWASFMEGWSQMLKSHPLHPSAFSLPAADPRVLPSWGFVNQISLRAPIYH